MRDGRREPIQVDLVEFDPSRMRLQARRSTSRLVPIVDAVVQLGRVGRGGDLPGDSAFGDLGLVRLAEVVATEGALAGVNGNFYVDYGVCLDARDLGIDLTDDADLHLGELVGWFVTDGVELAPPLFNRAVLAVTADHRAHIRRVAMADVLLPNSRRVTWGAVNHAESGTTVLWDRVAGDRTTKSAGHVDACISRSTVVDIRPGGQSHIPLLGFVLAIPASVAEAVLDGVRVGDEVVVGNDFPTGLGAVTQAMACGPQLVRDGQVDIDFDAEGLGEKDTTVLPLSLSRVVDSFRAARSFVFLRDGRVVFGVVSGISMGGGRPGDLTSVGMTFGELAQLCTDLGADDAIALDGGGSSSLVARVGDDTARVLNVPTGGSDVPRGSERFIRTFWLASEPGPPDGG